MPDRQQTPPRVVLFDSTTEQNFGNSNLSAVGRDQFNLSINLATGGAGHQHPSHVSESAAFSPPGVQGRPPVQRLSFLTRVYRRFRTRSRRQPRSDAQVLQESVNATRCLTQVAPELPTPRPPPPSPSTSAEILPDGSSITSLDSRSQSSLVRIHASSAEEVYERSLLPKGQGFPLFNPRRPVKFGDFGIPGQDGFESFGNLFDPKDQQEFSIAHPPQPNMIHQPEQLHEGQVISAGIEDVRRLADANTKATSRFEFHCREEQGAVLALTSSGDLETLTLPSTNQLREYLCSHGTQLMIRLRQKHCLQPGQSLYVVTGTIKSDSWAIAVHTSPMREGYNQMVLTRREGILGSTSPTHEWTRLGSADARCGASSIDVDGRHTKDQCLFLRGFLLTPSFDQERQAKPSTNGNSSAEDSSSSPDPADSENSSGMGWKGGSAHSGQGKSNDRSSSSEGSLQHQLQDIFQPVSLVQPFPATTSDSKLYFPSRRINDMLLENPNINLAITHDDEWRDSFKIRCGYLDDEALSTLMADFWEENRPSVSKGVATTIPVAGRTNDPRQNGCSVDRMGGPTTQLCDLLPCQSWFLSAEKMGLKVSQSPPEPGLSDWGKEELPASLDGATSATCGPKALIAVSQSPMRIVLEQLSLRNHEREGQVNGRLITEGVRGLTTRRSSSMLSNGREMGPSHPSFQGSTWDNTLWSFCDGGANKSKSNLHTFQMLCASITDNHYANRYILAFLLSGHSSGTNLNWQMSTKNGMPVAYSPNGTHIVSSSYDKLVRVWDTTTGGEVGVLKRHTDSVLAVAYSPDGTHVVSGSDDHSVRVWDISTGEEVRVLEGHINSVLSVAYSPDGAHVVSGSYDKSVRVWDVYSPDETHVVSSSDDHSVRVWDISTGEEVRVLEGHINSVLSVAYSPDGAYVVSGSYGKPVRVWDVTTGEEVRVSRGRTDRVHSMDYRWMSPSMPSLSQTINRSGCGPFQSSIPSRYCLREQSPNGEYTGWLASPTDPKAYLTFARPEAFLPHGPNVVPRLRSLISTFQRRH